jgi:hypothetical protein
LAGLALEDLLHVFEERQSELGKIGGTLILHRDIHGPADALRHIGGARNEQSAKSWHEILPESDLWGIISLDRVLATTP